ncbi:MAG: phospholipase D family protein [Deltaproteobacteria bacterium]|nr:phospholipase D family protein [Deltaproteobacteria bacterium]
MRARLLTGRQLHDEVIRARLLGARRSVLIATANVKAMLVESGGRWIPIIEALAELARRGVETRILHADRPSRPFRDALQRHRRALAGRLEMRVCPRVHFKLVLVDGGWAYLGSANLTGAGLGAKDEARRNFEIGLGTDDPEVLDHADAVFHAVWNGAECGACRLRDLCPAPLGPAAPRAARRRPSGAPSGLELGRPRRLPIPR